MWPGGAMDQCDGSVRWIREAGQGAYAELRAHRYRLRNKLRNSCRKTAQSGRRGEAGAETPRSLAGAMAQVQKYRKVYQTQGSGRCGAGAEPQVWRHHHGPVQPELRRQGGPEKQE